MRSCKKHSRYWAWPGCGNHRTFVTRTLALDLDLLIGATLRAFVIACGTCTLFALSPVRRRRFAYVFIGALIGGVISAIALPRFF